MRHKCGLAQRLYHPLWDEDLQSLEDGIRCCNCPTQVIMGDYLQGHKSVFHHSDMYLSKLVTSTSQRSLINTSL